MAKYWLSKYALSEGKVKQVECKDEDSVSAGDLLRENGGYC